MKTRNTVNAKSLARTPLAKAIYARRAAGHLTLRGASNDSGIPLSTLYGLETDPRPPNVATLIRVAKWLGMDPGDLIPRRKEKR